MTCSIQVINVTATGGVSYLWSNGATTAANSFSSPGTYTVTAKGMNGCSNTANLPITQDTLKPVASITNNSGSSVLTCSIPLINVTATGGSTYLWSTGTTTAANSFSSPGDYTVTVTGANGCSSEAGISITQNIGKPVAGITNNTGTTILTCTTTSINVTATGGISYSWSNGIKQQKQLLITRHLHCYSHGHKRMYRHRQHFN